MNPERTTPTGPRVDPAGGLHLEVLHVQDCPNVRPLLRRLHDITDTPVRTREIRTEAEAAAHGMAGSPTLLIKGADPFATPNQRGTSLSCRLYRDEQGHSVPLPTVWQLDTALGSAAGHNHDSTPDAGAGQVLAAWRARALPPGRIEKAVHQAILRASAGTGEAPLPTSCDP
jgi:hypothetical protein